MQTKQYSQIEECCGGLASMPGTLFLRFSRPYSWSGSAEAPSVFDAHEAQHRGIYLRTVALPEGHLIYDAGQTGEPLGWRLLDEYRWHAAGMSRLYAPAEFARGEKALVWPGCRDAEPVRSVSECVAEFPRLAHTIHGLTSVYRFLLAPLDASSRLRERALAAIAASLQAQQGLVRSFQEISAPPPRRQMHEPPLDCRVSCTVSLQGLPEQLAI
jgi:hypothetical protein